jgi:hypothetical protein
MDHHQFFKHLVRAFFGDLLRIVVPDLARGLDADRPTFLESELFTSVPAGKHRRLDLVAEVPSARGGAELVLVHVEVERRARRAMGRRLLDYAMQLWLEHHEPVVPIVLYLRGGKPDVHREILRIGFQDETLMAFTYFSFGFSRSRAEAYLRRPEPLAWAVAGLMHRGRLSRAEHKLACLRPIVEADLDEARRFLLAECVETYVQLDEAARQEYRALLAEPQNREVATMELTWSGQIAQEVREHALREGREEGREEGRRELLLDLLERRFGPLPGTTVRRVQQLTTAEELSALAARIFDARSLKDLGL